MQDRLKKSLAAVLALASALVAAAVAQGIVSAPHHALAVYAVTALTLAQTFLPSLLGEAPVPAVDAAKKVGPALIAFGALMLGGCNEATGAQGLLAAGILCAAFITARIAAPPIIRRVRAWWRWRHFPLRQLSKEERARIKPFLRFIDPSALRAAGPRPSPRTMRCECILDGPGNFDRAHRRWCPDYTEEDAAWCAAQYEHAPRGHTPRHRARPLAVILPFLFCTLFAHPVRADEHAPKSGTVTHSTADAAATPPAVAMPHLPPPVVANAQPDASPAVPVAAPQPVQQPDQPPAAATNPTVPIVPGLPPECSACAAKVAGTVAPGKGWPTWATVVLVVVGAGLSTVEALHSAGVIGQ